MRRNVECADCGGRLKVEMITADQKWIVAHCPHCGADLPLRRHQPPTHEAARHASARRKELDRVLIAIFWTVIILLSVVLLIETVRTQ